MTDYFDKTSDLEYYLRPMSWFELIYDVNCRGKLKCDIDVDALNLNSLMKDLDVYSSIESKNKLDWDYND